jgi:hypothetical protein
VALINSVISWLIKQRIHQIELFIKYPHEVQDDWLKRLLVDAQDTEWGIKYDYKSIENVDDYRNRVPLSDYEVFSPYIQRLIKGEQNLLWSTDIKWFAKSSGTTSEKSKFIPISRESLEECHYKGGKDMFAIYCNNNPDTYIFDGKGLAISGSRKFFEVNNEAYYGDLSAIIIQNLPLWAEFYRIPDLSIALMDEWESKIDKLAAATISKNVTNISGVPSWTLLLIKKVLEISGKKNLCLVWQNLELYAHGGVNFKPYREQFEKLIPSDKMHYLETYTASEGFFGIQDRNNADDMLLMLDYGIFYEFIPVHELTNSPTHQLTNFPKALSLHEVELGKNYALAISTNGGLWRYLIGDTIKFTSLNPYRIQITGRTKSFINAFGEEVIVDNAERALNIACEKSESVINEYTAAPVYIDEGKNAAHEWLIEFEKPPLNLEYFSEILDNALKSLNSDYEAKRYRNLILNKPIIRSIPKGTFYNWLKKRGRLGGQNKVPRLSNDRQYIEEILSLI